MIRYRISMDRRTGKLLRGAACLEQSIGRIITTRPEEIAMLLEFGADLMRRIGRNMQPSLVLEVYRTIVRAVHRWEPEYRIARLRLVHIDRTGGLGLGLEGVYFPEGRFGNYQLSQPLSLQLPLEAA